MNLFQLQLLFSPQWNEGMIVYELWEQYGIRVRLTCSDNCWSIINLFDDYFELLYLYDVKY
jgi:hypothetical protein